MESTIKIDAFNTNLHGCRLLCQGPFPKGQVPPIMESIQKLREPFKKKILLSHTAFSLSKYVPVQYDAVFQIKDGQDWTLALTYMTYAPKPLLIISEDLTIPDGLWQKLNRSMTFVNITSSPIINVRAYDAIFFAPIQEASPFMEYVYKTLQTFYRTSYTQKEHKEIVNELRVAGAGIAWSKVDEESQGGSIFWYDPIQQNPGDKLTNTQLAELFSFLSDHFSQ
uniref:Uncharacterized protein n=1 Tax=viral metagenome TaxID=1070528 RepID=A0A6C0KTT0_9ZZZZ